MSIKNIGFSRRMPSLFSFLPYGGVFLAGFGPSDSLKFLPEGKKFAPNPDTPTYEAFNSLGESIAL